MFTLKSGDNFQQTGYLHFKVGRLRAEYDVIGDISTGVRLWCVHRALLLARTHSVCTPVCELHRVM